MSAPGSSHRTAILLALVCFGCDEPPGRAAEAPEPAAQPRLTFRYQTGRRYLYTIDYTRRVAAERYRIRGEWSVVVLSYRAERIDLAIRLVPRQVRWETPKPGHPGELRRALGAYFFAALDVRGAVIAARFPARLPTARLIARALLAITQFALPRAPHRLFEPWTQQEYAPSGSREATYQARLVKGSPHMVEVTKRIPTGKLTARFDLERGLLRTLDGDLASRSTGLEAVKLRWLATRIVSSDVLIPLLRRSRVVVASPPQNWAAPALPPGPGMGRAKPKRP